jgi:hypothetical protein
MKFLITVAYLIFCIVGSAEILAATPSAKSKQRQKVQEISFSEMSLNGTIRKADGAYLVQKRGIRFQPLFKIQEDFDRKIRESFLYID